MSACKRLGTIVVVLVGFGLAAPATSAEVRGFDVACPTDAVPDDAFLDVPSVNAHEDAIDCIAYHGIAGGVTDNRFGPDGMVSRAQLATFMARLIDAAGTALPDNVPDAFDDDTDSPHEHNINRLAAAGVVGGVGPRVFDPSGIVSRAQMATFLVRSYELAAGQALPAGDDAFADDDGSDHEANIDKAAAAGFAGGTGPAMFSPAAPVRRDQMGSFLARALDRLADDELVEPAAATFVLDLDPDFTIVSGAADAVRVGSGVIAGIDYRRSLLVTVAPQQSVTVRFDLGSVAWGDDRAILGVTDDSADGFVRYRMRNEAYDRGGVFSRGFQADFTGAFSTFTFIEFTVTGEQEAGLCTFVLGDAVVVPPARPTPT